jgi:Tol biopolymer transport system component
MRVKLLVCLLLVLIFGLVSGGAQERAKSANGYSLSESLLTPRVFGEGVFSTDAYDITPTFTPDGRTAFFTVSNPSYRRHTLLLTHFSNGKWQTPEVAPFSGQWSDADPFISHDGSKLYFISNRPVTGNTPKRDFDLYVVEKTVAGWGVPKNLGAPLNSDASELYITVTTNGTIYFVTSLPGGLGQGDIYRAPLVNGQYAKPENLGPTINSPGHDTTPYIAPDESYLIFASTRPNGVGDQDLYVSYRREGVWTQAVNLGPKINSPTRDYCPLVSPDGKYLFFSSDRGFPFPYDGKQLTYRELMNRFRSLDNGLGNVYQVELAAVPR